MPGPEIQNVYLDALEEHPLEEILDAPLGRRPKPEVLGTPVPIEEHRAAFERKWDDEESDDKKSGEPPEPLTRARPATDEEMNDEARAWAAKLDERGIAYRFTFAQGGEWRETARLGRCAHCGDWQKLYVDDGTVRKHRTEKRKCPGVGKPPGMPRMVGRQGVIPCGHCDKPIKPTKKALVPSHDLPALECPGGQTIPAEISEPEPVEPIRSLALRALPFCVVVWHDGVYELGYAYNHTDDYLQKMTKTQMEKVINGSRPEDVQAKQRTASVRKASAARWTMRRSPARARS